MDGLYWSFALGGGLSLRSHNPVGVRYLAPDDLRMIDDCGDLSGDYWYDDVDVDVVLLVEVVVVVSVVAAAAAVVVGGDDDAGKWT